jgi:hypothetical protein
VAQETKELTTDRAVSYNLRQARVELRDWTQREAADRLEPYLDQRWDSPTFVVAERWDPKPGQKTRQFKADEIAAFAAVFDVPLSFFFRVPDGYVLRVGRETLYPDVGFLREQVIGVVAEHQRGLLASLDRATEQARGLAKLLERLEKMEADSAAPKSSEEQPSVGSGPPWPVQALYRSLGLPDNATPEQVKKAFADRGLDLPESEPEPSRRGGK